jgi:hypothetical protein
LLPHSSSGAILFRLGVELSRRRFLVEEDGMAGGFGGANTSSEYLSGAVQDNAIARQKS